MTLLPFPPTTLTYAQVEASAVGDVVGSEGRFVLVQKGAIDEVDLHFGARHAIQILRNLFLHLRYCRRGGQCHAYCLAVEAPLSVF